MLVALQTVPKVAIAPLMIVWFRLRHFVEDRHRRNDLRISKPGQHHRRTPRCRFPTDCSHHRDVRLARALLRYVQRRMRCPTSWRAQHRHCVAVISAIVASLSRKNGVGVLILQANFGLDLASMFAVLCCSP